MRLNVHAVTVGRPLVKSTGKLLWLLMTVMILSIFLALVRHFVKFPSFVEADSNRGAELMYRGTRNVSSTAKMQPLGEQSHSIEKGKLRMVNTTVDATTATAT